MFVDVRDLPKTFKEILKRIGFNRREISFITAQHLVFKQSISIPYHRGFVILINTKTGRYRIGVGSYGGTNQYIKTIIDDCNYKFNIPENIAVIKGEHGQSGVWATLIMRPEEVPPFELLKEDSIDRIYKLLKQLFVAKHKHQQTELLKTFRANDIGDCIRLSYIVSRGRQDDYVKITKRGKKFIRQYEDDFPDKVIL